MIGRHIHDLMAGLKVLHDCGLVHMDVEPRHLGIQTGTQIACIIDLSCARAVNDPVPHDKCAGAFVTLLYCLDELVRGKSMDN